MLVANDDVEVKIEDCWVHSDLLNSYILLIIENKIRLSTERITQASREVMNKVRYRNEE